MVCLWTGLAMGPGPTGCGVSVVGRQRVHVGSVRVGLFGAGAGCSDCKSGFWAAVQQRILGSLGKHDGGRWGVGYSSHGPSACASTGASGARRGIGCLGVLCSDDVLMVHCGLASTLCRATTAGGSMLASGGFDSGRGAATKRLAGRSGVFRITQPLQR